MSDVIEIYTDGSCSGNDKANTKDSYGGWGVYLKFKGKEKTLNGGATNTSNNQMEMQAVIEALAALTTKALPTVIYSDSAYVINGITQWIDGWVKNGWKTSEGKAVKNAEIWMELHELVVQFKDLKFVKVKGHSGVEGNEIADKLAVSGSEEYRRRCSNGEKKNS